LGLGWLVYRRAGQTDPIRRVLGPIYTLLEHKYYFDELYDLLFVRPAKWFAEQFTYMFLDRTVIDGILHRFARIAFSLGRIFRNNFDAPVINGFGDFTASVTQSFGRLLRRIQTGEVQQYLLFVALLAFGGLFYYLLNVLK
jgi:NADH-quinone oxidoreductase subunit L